MEKKDISSLLLALAGTLVPAHILESFEVIDIEEGSESITIDLREKETLTPKGSKKLLVLNGYMNMLELQSFPVKAKACYLRLYRRRWKEKGSECSQVYANQYDYAAKGTKATKELGAFLKDFL